MLIILLLTLPVHFTVSFLLLGPAPSTSYLCFKVAVFCIAGTPDFRFDVTYTLTAACFALPQYPPLLSVSRNLLKLKSTVSV